MTARAGLGRRQFLGWLAAGAALAPVPGAAAPRRPRRGGVLKHVGLDPPTLDIHAPGSYQAQLMSSFTRRGLFKFVNGPRHGASDFALVPDLALHASASGDGRVYTIALRRGVRWESRPPVNGRELVAADVAYSLDRALRKSPYASLLGPVEGVEAVSSHTVRVHLRAAFSPFLQNLAEPCHAILPPEVEDRFGDFRSPESLIGCGPFALERYEPGIKAVFTRNPTYHDSERPYLDRVEWIFVKDRATQWALFRAGQVDIPSADSRIPLAEAATIRGLATASAPTRWEPLGARALALRVDRPPLSDPRVRRALSLAVDRKRWVAEELAHEGHEVSGPVPPALTQWRLPIADLGEGAMYLEHDPALARRLLAEAGFPNGLKLRCASWAGHGPEHAEDLRVLTADLRRAGVELGVVEEDWAGYGKGTVSGRAEEAAWETISCFSEVDGYLYGLYRSGAPGNRSRVLDAELDVMLDAQRSAASRSARKRVIDHVQRRLAAQVYCVYAPQPKAVSSWAPRVKNYAPKNSLDRGAQLESVWLDEG